MEASSSEFFTAGGYFSHHADREYNDQQKPAIVVVDNVNNTNNNFAVDDLLDFPKEEDDDDDVITDAFFDSITGNSGDSSSLTVVDSCNSSISGGDANGNGSLSCGSVTDTQFSGSELCVPYDDLAELEWLSNFVDDSFSSDDLQNLHLISPNTTNSKAPPPVTAADTSSSATTAIVNNSSSSISSIFTSDVSVPAKARSKRSRAAPCDWSSRLLLLSPAAAEAAMTSLETNITAPNSLNFQPKVKSLKTTASKRREREASTETPGRKCLHCASEKTPQWRTGPMGPKTLCNACGVRYKSGRLVPEYRPASSPTFVSAKHSNSHRKVMELRRQKEMHHHHQQQQQHLLSHQSSIFGVSNGGNEFFFHHHHQNVGPDYRLAYDLKCDGVPK